MQNRMNFGYPCTRLHECSWMGHQRTSNPEMLGIVEIYSKMVSRVQLTYDIPNKDIEATSLGKRRSAQDAKKSFSHMGFCNLTEYISNHLFIL